MRVEKILVTGGAGFIGSNLVDYIQRNYKNESECPLMTVLDALTYAGNKENLSGLDYPGKLIFVHGDVRDSSLVDELVKKNEIIFHLAAESHVDRSIADPSIFIDTNVRGTSNILEAARKYHKKVILISTDEVYGSIENGCADENYKLNPSSPYSASKASADLLALAYFKTFSLDVIITRCTNNYGPKQYPEKLIPQTIKKVMMNQKIPIYGNGSNIRDWIHVEDHCSGLFLAMKHGKPGEIYNFGDVDKVTNLEIVDNILKLMGKSNELIEFVTDRLGHDMRYSVNSMKAKEDLNWQPKYNLSNSLGTTIKWYKSSA
jgi:dTDP-glucose 4,6-dehydratase